MSGTCVSGSGLLGFESPASYLSQHAHPARMRSPAPETRASRILRPILGETASQYGQHQPLGCSPAAASRPGRAEVSDFATTQCGDVQISDFEACPRNSAVLRGVTTCHQYPCFRQDNPSVVTRIQSSARWWVVVRTIIGWIVLAYGTLACKTKHVEP